MPPTRRGYSDLHVALVCHKANQGIQQAQKLHGNDQVTLPGELIDLHPDLLAAAIEGVRAIRSGETQNPRQHHERWTEFLAGRGWHPGERHREAKTHPNLVPWADLPPGERDKDRVLLGIVVSLTLDAEGCP